MSHRSWLYRVKSPFASLGVFGWMRDVADQYPFGLECAFRFDKSIWLGVWSDGDGFGRAFIKEFKPSKTDFGLLGDGFSGYGIGVVISDYLKEHPEAYFDNKEIEPWLTKFKEKSDP